MRLKNGAHLSYCTNVHPGEDWPAVRAILEGPVPGVKRRVAAGVPFGIGLRLGARAARTLRDPEVRAELVDVLRRTNTYVFSVNAFPFGSFHDGPVKEGVYRPDWRERARLDYTLDVANVLATVLPDGVVGSISTVPVADAFRAQREVCVALAADGILAALSGLVETERRTGKRIVLALEPEPECLLETAQDAATFFRRHLLSKWALARFGAGLGVDTRSAEPLLRRHAGVCLDACHAAVSFETGREALAALSAEGITIAKLQVSAGLEVEGAASARSLLPAFDDGVYLHQTRVAQPDGELASFRDLDRALAVSPDGVWRVHVHVPVDRDPSPPLRTTRRHLEDLLAVARASPDITQFEVETYTWSVLPPHARGEDLETDIAAELRWTQERLEGA